MTPLLPRRTGLGVLACVVGLVLASLTSCSSDSSDDSSSGQTTDRVALATELMHRDAALLLLLDAALGQPAPATVAGAVELARADASTRIETAADLLEEWGEEVPVTVRDHGIDHGVEVDVPDLDGAPTEDEIHALADSEEFADDFTELFRGSLESTRDFAATYAGNDSAAADLALTAEQQSQDTLDKLG